MGYLSDIQLSYTIIGRSPEYIRIPLIFHIYIYWNIDVGMIYVKLPLGYSMNEKIMNIHGIFLKYSWETNGILMDN